MGALWLLAERRLSFSSAWSVVNYFSFRIAISKRVSYSTKGNTESSTDTEIPGMTHPVRDLSGGLTPEAIATMKGYPTKLQMAYHLNQILAAETAAVVERAKKEAMFHAGDVLAHRYKLVDKHNKISLEDFEGFQGLQAVNERRSWNTRWEAVDLKTSGKVLVEVNESGHQDHYTAAVRSGALHALAGQHPNILQLLDMCEHRTHQGRHAVVVTELPGSSLQEVCVSFGGRAAESALMSPRESSKICLASRMDGIKALKSIARQLFMALSVLHRRGIIHMNIHQQNILLDKPFKRALLDLDFVPHTILREGYLPFNTMKQSYRQPADPDSYNESNLHTATVKLTGFSQAVFSSAVGASRGGPWSFKVPRDRDGRPVETPAQLRAPEEILGLNYTAPSYDIWQAGLALFHLATGRELFCRGFLMQLRAAIPRLEAYGDDDLYLADMVDVLGTLPRELIRRSPRFDELYLPSDNLRVYRVLNRKKQEVSKLVQKMTDWKIPLHEAEALHQFITHILIPDPSRRPTAEVVLKHPWLAGTGEQSD